MVTRQAADQAAMLAVEMPESGIILKHMQPLPLVKDDPDRAVLEDEAGFTFQKDGQILVN